jgi:hypothetical protein
MESISFHRPNIYGNPHFNTIVNIFVNLNAIVGLFSKIFGIKLSNTKILNEVVVSKRSDQ